MQSELPFYYPDRNVLLFGCCLSDTAFYLTAETWKPGECSLKKFTSTHGNERTKQTVEHSNVHTYTFLSTPGDTSKTIRLSATIARIKYFDGNYVFELGRPAGRPTDTEETVTSWIFYIAVHEDKLTE